MQKDFCFSYILYVGPTFVNHRGGIGAVLSTYRDTIPKFNFVATFDGNHSPLGNLFLFIRSLITLSSKLISNNQIKIVHIHGASKGSFYRKFIIFLLTRHLFQKKVVYHIHGGKFHHFYKKSNPITKRCISYLINNVSQVICLSNNWKKYFLDTFNPITISVVNNPIQIPEKSLPENIEKAHLNILFLGKIGTNKGIFDLIDVLSIERKYFSSKVKLKICGNGDIHRLMTSIRSNELDSFVEYVGWVDGKHKESLLVETDVLILPSHNEGLPISILEAMSYGKAIIASNVGGIPEIVRNGENGYLVDAGDKEAIGISIKKLIDNESILKAFGEESFRISKKYDIKVVIKELDSIYKKLTSSERLSEI